MTKPLYYSTIILFSMHSLNAPLKVNGWMPRHRYSIPCNGVRTKNSGGIRNDVARQQKMSLSVSGDANNNEELHLPGGKHENDDATALPLLAEGVEKQQSLHLDISRLEAIYDMDLELFSLDDKSNDKSQRLLSDERVIIGDWMSGERNCSGDYCGDDFDQCDIPEEFKISNPKVDVMTYLGIRRAVPVQVSRDWD